MMNERIKELAEQAWMMERIEKDPDYKKSAITEYLLNGMERFHEKFAESIVRECAIAILENSKKNTHSRILFGNLRWKNRLG